MDVADLIAQASGPAIRRAIRIHRAFEVPMVEWRDGRIQLVQPDDPRLQEILNQESSN